MTEPYFFHITLGFLLFYPYENILFVIYPVPTCGKDKNGTVVGQNLYVKAA